MKHSFVCMESNNRTLLRHFFKNEHISKNDEDTWLKWLKSIVKYYVDNEGEPLVSFCRSKEGNDQDACAIGDYLSNQRLNNTKKKLSKK